MKKSGGLALINDYGSDTEDDEVPGPRVSTKRTHKDDSEDNDKKKQRLPIPQSILNKNGTNSEHIDDPNCHNGRKRSFAHERGNWPTYIYIPFEAHVGVKEMVDFIKKMIPESLQIFEVENYHISLTKTVILRHHWIDSFVQSIKNVIHCKFRSFLILFGELNIYCNEEKSRTFIGIQARTGYDTLANLVKSLDTTLEEFKLPTFYDDPSFHMSIAWCLGDHREELEKYLDFFNEKFSEIIQNHPHEEWHILVEFLTAKIGNKFFQFYLS